MPQTSQRESNFELLRLVAMMLVLLVHANYLSIGNVSQAELHATPLSGIVRIVCEQLCIVSVNLFILISGWFGIRPTVKKVASMLFQVLFIGLVSTEVCRLIGGDVPSADLGRLLYFGANYWFVPAYLILFCLSPILNAYCEKASRRDFTLLLVSFFVLEMIFGWLNFDAGHYGRGYSALSFIGLYLLAQYIRRHGQPFMSKLKSWHCLLSYLLFTAIPATIAFCGLYFKNKEFGATSYSSLFVVAASVSLMLLFAKLHFKSRVVNWMASSAFAIYLTHQAPGMFDLYANLFKESYNTIPGVWFIPYALGVTAIIGFVSILLDKVRLVAWNGVLRLASKVKPQS